MSVKAKICGIQDVNTARLAAKSGADFLGFINFLRSPRHVELGVMAELMAAIRENGVSIPLVSVVVDPDDTVVEILRDRVRPDLIQLHGHETPERVSEIAARSGLPLIKVISVGDAADLDAATAFEAHVAYLMFDAKTPKDAALPGGMGLRFDWPMMQGYSGARPWFLAGGLKPDNVADAVRLSGASLIDVSSGVESAPGRKDAGLISDFLRAAKAI